MLRVRPRGHEAHQEDVLKVEYIEETSVRKALSFEIEPDVVEKEIQTRLRDYSRKAKLPGFRPGKIPPEVIRQRFRGQVLEDVAEALVNKVVFEELEGRGLKPLAMPRVTDLKMDEGQPMTFRAVFETLPLVELPDYRGIEVKARHPVVADEEVDAEVDRLREDAARFDPVEDRPARVGDSVVLDVDYRTSGGKQKHDDNVLVEVGAEENHADLNAALEGMSPGDTKQVHLVYPADHPSEALAGQTVDYTVTAKAVKTKVVPAADDEFAKDLGDFGSLAELRDHVRQRLQAAADRQADREAKEAIVATLAERASFEVPDTLVERHMSARTEGVARDLAYQGIDPTKAGVDWKQFRESQREASVKAAKADILLDEIARREGVEVLEAELDAEVARLAGRVRKSKEAVRGQMEKEGSLSALRARLREEKTLDLLKANARLDFE
jgi:trigger factor